jgi:hypothetical protein
VEGKLSISQLRLAYSTLVRSATMTSTTGVLGDTYTLAWYCVQLLVDTIRDLSPQSYTSQKPKSQGTQPPKKHVDNGTVKADDDDDDRIHRLSLMLISTISSLPMTIMLRALDEVYNIIISAYSSYSSSSTPQEDDRSGVVDRNNNDKFEDGSELSERKGRRKKELLEALFSEILDKVGDCEKEAAMKWWYTYRPFLISESGHVDGRGDSERQEGLGLLASSSWFMKRWRGVGKVKDVDAGEREINQSSSNSFVLSRL